MDIIELHGHLKLCFLVNLNFHAIIFRSILMLSFDHYEMRLPCQHHIIAARGHVM